MSLKGIVISLIIGAGIGVVASLIGAEQIEKTGTPEFCISCHEMKPMYDTWLKGPHGPLGNKAGAIRASCTDCHLPHDSVVSYLTEKIRTAMKDAYYHNKKELINNVDFWLEKLDPKEVKKYTYESNCIHCHVKLPNNALHEKYKKGEIKDTCLDCHWYVGHGFYYEEYLKEYFESKNKKENNTNLE